MVFSFWEIETCSLNQSFVVSIFLNILSAKVKIRWHICFWSLYKDLKSGLFRVLQLVCFSRGRIEAIVWSFSYVKVTTIAPSKLIKDVIYQCLHFITKYSVIMLYILWIYLSILLLSFKKVVYKIPLFCDSIQKALFMFGWIGRLSLFNTNILTNHRVIGSRKASFSSGISGSCFIHQILSIYLTFITPLS